MAVVDFHGVRLNLAHLGTGFWAAWEPEETALVLDTVEAGDRVLVAGGGFGWLAALCVSIVGIDNVVVYEAQRELALCLSHNVRADGCPLRTIPGALSDTTRSVQLWEHPWWAAASLHRRAGEHGKVRTVQAFGVNEVVALHRANVLVLDIEGSEWDVARALDWAPIRAAVIEVHDTYLRDDGKDPQDVTRAMTEGGLTVRAVRVNEAGTHWYVAGVRV